MHKDFYIFRHGETDYNKEQRWQGQGIDIPLNETGLIQAEKLANKLKDYKLEVVYSSPLIRARQTAEKVAAQQNIKVKILNDLTESCVGVCEGMLRSEVAQKFPDIWSEWYGKEMIMTTRWPEGESKLEVQQRMFKAFNRMLSTSEKVIGVASHGGAMRYFLLAFGYGPHKMPNTALFHLIYDNDKWILEDLN